MGFIEKSLSFGTLITLVVGFFCLRLFLLKGFSLGLWIFIMFPFMIFFLAFLIVALIGYN